MLVYDLNAEDDFGHEETYLLHDDEDECIIISPAEDVAAAANQDCLLHDNLHMIVSVQKQLHTKGPKLNWQVGAKLRTRGHKINWQVGTKLKSSKKYHKPEVQEGVSNCIDTQQTRSRDARLG